MRLYRAAAMAMTAGFLLVGILLLAVPDGVLALFNRLSGWLGLPEAPPVGHSFFIVLASGYMYLVSLLAWLMLRHPENRTYATLLVQAKLATALFSLGFFLAHRPFLIYLVNFVVDGLLAAGVWWIARTRRGGSR